LKGVECRRDTAPGLGWFGSVENGDGWGWVGMGGKHQFNQLGQFLFILQGKIKHHKSLYIYVYIFPGWWFGTWFFFLHILGIIIPTD